MRIEEIEALYTTLCVDRDEVRVLAAACEAAAIVAEGSVPGQDIFAKLGNPEVIAMILEGYAVMFEAVRMASTVHFAVKVDEAKELTLSAIRTRGTGGRLGPHRPDGEGGGAAE